MHRDVDSFCLCLPLTLCAPVKIYKGLKPDIGLTSKFHIMWMWLETCGTLSAPAEMENAEPQKPKISSLANSYTLVV
jgi:hypothetical protein